MTLCPGPRPSPGYSFLMSTPEIVLIAVAILSFAIQDYIEAGVVVAVILLNIIVGYVFPSIYPSVPPHRSTLLHPKHCANSFRLTVWSRTTATAN